MKRAAAKADGLAKVDIGPEGELLREVPANTSAAGEVVGILVYISSPEVETF